MSKTPNLDKDADKIESLAQRSARAADGASELFLRSDAAVLRLRGGKPADDGHDHQAPEPTQEPSDQMERQHVLIVNTDPAFLDAARVILQAGLYNVTTTNHVPLTYAMIDAVGADVLVIDLAIGEPKIWSLVNQLHEGATTRSLPIVFTSAKPELLDRAEKQQWHAGGRYVFLKPFDPKDLLDAVQSLIGDA